MPVFCSSVALLRRFPYCSYRWHTRQATPSYRQDKNAPFRPALRYSDPSRASPRPSYRAGGAFFISSPHPLTVPCHLIVSRLVSSPVSNIAGRYASRPVPRPGLVPSSVSDEAGRRASRRPISSCPCGGVAISSSRLVRRLGFSCRRASRFASCRRVVSSDEGEASKTGRVIILGPVSFASVPSSVRPGVSSPGHRAVIVSSPHHPASKQDDGENGGGLVAWAWGLFSCSAGAAIIPGAGVMLSSSPRRSPVPFSIQHHIEKKTRQASRQV